MTDRVNLANDFSRKVTRVQRGYTKTVLQLLREHRQELVELVLSVGVDSPRLTPLLSGQMQALSREVVRAGRELRPALLGVTRHSAVRQVEYYVSNVPAAPKISVPANTNKAELAVSVIEETPGWVQGYFAALVTGINRLRTAAPTDDEAAAQLFSERLVDERASIYRKTKNAAVVQSDNLVWAAAGAALGAFVLDDGAEMWKQAIAAIDERTTDCCLRVHGQIRPLNGRFQLDGRPRFAPRLPWAPFHWWCRTSVGLYHPIYDEIEQYNTSRMEEAAREERLARSRTGKREEIHPADATSRRGQ